MRRQPRRRGKTSTVLNPKYIDPLIPLVGKFMVNFGAVELLSHLWVDSLAQDEVLVDFAFETPFGRRVDLIERLLAREESVPSELKERAAAAWSAARDLAEVRNAVAHNPAVFGWHGPEHGEPHFIGIPIVRKLARSADGQVPYVGPDGLAKAVDFVVALAQDLEQQLEQVKRALHPDGQAHPNAEP